MFFKLSRKYQDFDFVNRVTDKKNVHYLMHHDNWFLFQQIFNFRKNLKKHKIKYFRDLPKKIINEDFDQYITEIENICQNEMSVELLKDNYVSNNYDNESDNESDSDIDEELIF